jgi:chloramphenicol O-acetyltransferase type B
VREPVILKTGSPPSKKPAKRLWLSEAMVKFTREVLSSQIEQFGWSIGGTTYGAPVVRTWGGDEQRLTIGEYCSIAGGVTIFLGGNHRTDWVTTYPFNRIDKAASHIKGHPATRGPVRIGNDVWIGAGAVILSGVSIGDGACIGASSVVGRDVAPYAIVAGNPAVEVRKRFTDQQIARLIALKWWNWSPDVIRTAYPMLLSSDIDALLEWGERLPSPSSLMDLEGKSHD